jgi:glutathione S-transferase
MLHLWGRLSSINVRKVVWAVQELGLEMQRTDAGAQYGRVLEPEYLQLNPNGLVPLLQDDATTLWESNVIVRYLCARHAAGSLYPQALPSRFAAEQWMDWQQTTLNPAGREAFVQLVRRPPEQRNAGLIAQSVAATAPLLALLDAHLAAHAFMAGDHFSMADIPIGCEIHRWWGLPLPRASHVHLERWYAALRARRAAAGVLDLALS